MTTLTSPAPPAVGELRAATARTQAVIDNPYAGPTERHAAAQAEASLYDHASPQAVAELDAEAEAG